MYYYSQDQSIGLIFLHLLECVYYSCLVVQDQKN